MGGKSGSQARSRADASISDFVNEYRSQTAPIRENVFAQMAEALKTGGVQAQIPMINRAVEASKKATSDALASIDTSLGSSRLAGTPFGQRIRAETLRSGEFATSQIGPGIAKDFIAQAFNVANASPTNITQGLSAAADVGVRQRAIGAQEAVGEMQMWGQIISSLMSSVASVSKAGGAGAACWIAAAIYGYGSREYWAARRFLFGRWRGPLADAVRALYVRVGPGLAPYVRRWRWLRTMLKPLFDVAVARGSAGPNDRFDPQGEHVSDLLLMAYERKGVLACKSLDALLRLLALWADPVAARARITEWVAETAAVSWFLVFIPAGLDTPDWFLAPVRPLIGATSGYAVVVPIDGPSLAAAREAVECWERAAVA